MSKPKGVNCFLTEHTPLSESGVPRLHNLETFVPVAICNFQVVTQLTHTVQFSAPCYKQKQPALCDFQIPVQSDRFSTRRMNGPSCLQVMALVTSGFHTLPAASISALRVCTRPKPPLSSAAFTKHLCLGCAGCLGPIPFGAPNIDGKHRSHAKCHPCF